MIVYCNMDASVLYSETTVYFNSETPVGPMGIEATSGS